MAVLPFLSVPIPRAKRVIHAPMQVWPSRNNVSEPSVSFLLTTRPVDDSLDQYAMVRSFQSFLYSFDRALHYSLNDGSGLDAYVSGRGADAKPRDVPEDIGMPDDDIGRRIHREELPDRPPVIVTPNRFPCQTPIGPVMVFCYAAIGIPRDVGATADTE